MTAPAIEAIYRLSPLQEGMLFHTVLDPTSLAYVEQLMLDVAADVDAGALRRAVETLLARHTLLRSSFHWEGMQFPHQVVHRQVALPFEELDLRALPEADARARVEDFLAGDRRRGFTLTEAPLLRVTLVRLGTALSKIVLTHHHLLLDGWSTPIVLEELFALYAGALRGTPPRLPRRRPYGDYITWLQAQDLREAEAYWRSRLRGVVGRTALAEEAPETGGEEEHRELRVQLPVTSYAAMKELALRCRVTPSTVVQAAWAVVLSRFTGREDVVFGATVSGRPPELAGADEMVGLFINTLPVRVPLERNTRVEDLLSALHTQQVESRGFEYAPLAQVQEWSGVGAEGLFDSIVVYENYPFKAGEGGRFGNELLPIVAVDGFEQTNYPLTLVAITSETLHLHLKFDPRRVQPPRAERLLAHLARAIEELAVSPSRRVAELSLLSDAEREQVLRGFNGEGLLPEDARCVQELFEEQARLHGEREALVCGTQRVSYAELERRANQVAHRLRKEGVGPEVLVGLYLERTVDLVAGLLGVLKAGGAYVPLDPDYPGARVEQMLGLSGAKVLLTQQRLRGRLPEEGLRVVSMEEAAREEAAPVRRQGSADTLAYVLFTSGSTGVPKGVAISHGGLVELMHWGRESFTERELSGVLAGASVCFDLSVFELLVPLTAGGKVLLAANALEFPTLPARSEVRLLSSVPSAIAELVRLDDMEGVVGTVAAGEALPREVVDALYAKRTMERVYNLYGPTEVTVGSTLEQVPREERGWPSIGRNLKGTPVYVLDAGLNPVPVGVAGEVYVGGARVGRGYWRRPELTAERFIPDPFSRTPGARLYRTGDLARWKEDGRLDYLGRADHQVKVRGFRIELGEVEAVLRAQPGVTAAVCLVVGGSTGRLMGYVAAEPGAQLTDALLRQALGERLPRYMVPSQVVVLEALPLLPNGKVDRSALARHQPEAAPARVQGPRTPNEEVIAAAWAEVLGLEGVGIDEDFFSLGGHSLSATRVMSRLSDNFGTSLPLRALFEHPTVAKLAVYVAMHRQPGGAAVAPLRGLPRSEGARFPMSFAQERLWLIERLDPGRATYNVPLVLRLTGELRSEALDGALVDLVTRHESLRSRFVPRGDSAEVQVGEVPPSVLTVVDLGSHGAPEAEADRRTGTELETPFDLERGPLLRATLLRLAEGEHRLVLVMHHIVVDGWSMGVLLQDLAALYRARLEGRPHGLAVLDVQYPDFAQWQRAWLAGDVLASELSHWKERLEDAPRLLALPTDHPRPAAQSFSGAVEHFSLPAALADRLRALAREEQSTLFMTLLAAWSVLLSRWAHQHDLVVGTPIAGRNRPELEGLVGFFVNTLALRVNLEGDPTFRELLERVREVTLDAYAHQDVPFERIVTETQTERNASYNPIVQVVLALQNMPPARELALPGLTLRAEADASRTAKFDLTLSIADTPTGLVGGLEYATDLFSEATAQRMVRQLTRVLEEVAEAPEKRVSQVRLEAEEVLRARLEEWTRPSGEYPARAAVETLFEEVARQRWDAVAVVCGGQRVTYGELSRRSNQLGRYLRKQGVGLETPVGLFAPRGVEALVGLLGVLKAGGVYVPVDVKAPEERVRRVLEEVGAPVVLTVPSLRGRLEGVEARVVALGEEEAWRQESEKPLEEVAEGGERLAYVMYTSGSTGGPKGVAVPHRGVVRLVRGQQEYVRFGPEEVWLHGAALSFDASTLEVWGALLNGGRLVVVGEEEVGVEELGRVVKGEGVTVAWLTAGLFHVVVEEGLKGWEGVRQLVAGGDVLSRARVHKALGTVPGLVVVNGYGPTEGTTFTACHRVDSQEGLRATVPLGRAIGHTQAYVLNEALEVVAEGEEGEVYVGGEGLARGYWGQPGLTAEKFVPNPYGRGERLYRTGDRARWVAGVLEFVGRDDGQVKLRGFRVEVGEVEEALRGHPAVKQAAVVVEEEGGQKRLVGFVVAEAEVSAAGLKAHVAARLPEYMVPWAYEVVEALPLNANGKVDRRRLKQVRGRRLKAEGAAYEEARTPEERVLADIWRQVLGVPRVGVRENFFELGGDSILSIQVVARAGEKGLKLTPRQVFLHQTVEELARVARKALPEETEAEVLEGEVELGPIQQWWLEAVDASAREGASASAGGREPVRAESSDRAADASASADAKESSDKTADARAQAIADWFNQAMLVEPAEGVSYEDTQWALAQVAQRHEAFRLRCARREGQWKQWYAPAQEAQWPCEQVTLPQWDALESVAQRVQRGLSLEKGPVARAAWVECEGQRRLLLVAHHLMVDGVSWRLLLEEVEKALHARREGRTQVEWGPRTRSHGLYVRKLAQYARGEGAQQARYWLPETPQVQFASSPHDSGRAPQVASASNTNNSSVVPSVQSSPSTHDFGVALPVELESGANDFGSVQVVSEEVSEATTQALLREVPRAYRTEINDVLLAALAGALQKWTGRDEHVVGLEGHGREEWGEGAAEVSRTVGWFTSLYPVRLRVAPQEAIGERLKHVKQQLRQVPGRGLAFGAVRYLGTGEEADALRRQPLPLLSFNYLGQFDSGGAEGLLKLVPGPTGEAVHPRLRRQALLEAGAVVVDGRMRLSLGFSAHRHSEATAHRLLQWVRQGLEEVVAHVARGGCGRTPSDFPASQLTQREVDALVGRLGVEEVEDVYPLTPLQEGMLFHSLREPEAGAYVIQSQWRVEGLEEAPFVEAWKALVQRHAVLRTSFHVEGLGRAHQVVHRRAVLPVVVEDWTGQSEEAQRDRLQQRLERGLREGFELGRAPLMRLELLRLNEREVQVVWSYHHLLLDGWSIPLLLGELARLYAQGPEAASLLPPPQRYGDYLKWLSAQSEEGARAYWRHALDGFRTPTPLPGEGRGRKGHFGREEAQLEAGLLKRVEDFARRHKLTPSTVVQGAWALVLGRHAASHDVVFGTTVSGRPSQLPGVEQMVGLLINTVPVRVTLPDAEPVAAWLARLQREQVELREWEFTPLARVQEWSDVPRGTPLFDSLFVYENYPVSSANAEAAPQGRTINFISAEQNELNNFPLTLVAIPPAMPGTPMRLGLIHDEGRLSAALARRLLNHLSWMLDQVVSQPEAPLAALSSASPAEQRHLIESLNQTRRSYPSHSSVPAEFATVARNFADSVAVSQGERSLTYGELDRRSNQLARVLVERGVGRETFVGVCLERTPDLVVTLLAILKAGGAYVPLDSGLPSERLAFLLDDTQASVVVTSSALLDNLPVHPAQLVILDEDAAELDAASTAPLDVSVDPEQLAYVIYTSGSTGRPKGVAVPHRAILRLVRENLFLDVRPEDRVAQAASAAFDAATFEIWGALLAGARTVILSKEVALGGADFVQALRAERVSVLFLTTALFNQVAREQPSGFSSLRCVLFGGEAVEPRWVRAVLEAGGPERLLHVYGPTEVTTFSTFHPVTDVPMDARTVPIGLPIGNTAAYVLDGNLRPVGLGMPGELWLGGDGVARAYLDRPALTAERFCPDPFSGVPGARMYRSGDLVRRREDGAIEFVGRVDHQVKIRGFRIELGEIESVLSEHAQVAQVAVVAWEERGERRLVAYVAARGTEAPGTGALRRHLEERLPDYMVPARFVFLPELPLGRTGKVDRAALPAPEGDRPELESEFEAPRDARETALASIWAAELGVDRVGIHDNFFALGGDSIRSIQIRARAKEAGLHFTLKQLFEHPTVAGLAAAATATAAEGSVASAPFSLVPAADRERLPPGLEDAYPLTRLQAGMLFHSDFNVGAGEYHDLFTYELRARYDEAAFGEMLARILRRHSILRTSFDLSRFSIPLQLVHADLEMPLHREDLRGLEREAQEARILGWMEREKQRGFQWDRAPLMRCALFRRTEDSFQFGISFHHALLDGWSYANLLTELFGTYTQLLQDSTLAPLPPPRATYRDFVALEQQALASKEAESFWASELRGAEGARITPWPGAVLTPGRRKHEFVVAPAQAARLLALRHIGVSLKTVLLSTHLKVMTVATGQSDLVTGMVGHGRPEDVGGDTVMGLFLNTLPFRFQLRPGTFRELLLQVAAKERLIAQHGRYPMSEMQRRMGGTALFETAFNFVHAHVTERIRDFSGFEVVGGHHFSVTNMPLWVNFSLDPSTQGIVVEVEHDTALISPAHAAAIAGYYQRVLDALASDVEQRHDRLGFLSDAEREQVLRGFNAVGTHPEDGRSVQELFEEQARQHGEREALVCGTQRVSYAELERRANQVAHGLRKQGVGPEVLVGLYLERTVDLVAGLLGVLKAGGAYVPLDPDYPGARVEQMLGLSGAKVLLTQQRLRGRLPEEGLRVVSMEEAAREETAPVRRQGSADTLAYVLFTSGSTGIPKGVAITHRSVVSLMQWAHRRFSWRELSGVMAATSVCFDLSVFELLAPLTCGGKVVLAANALEFPELPARDEVRLINTVPSAMAELARGHSLEGVITVNLAGEALPRELVDALYAKRTVERVYNLYGPSEDTTYSTEERVPREERGRPSIGRALPGSGVYLLDAWLQPVPLGVAGEVYLGGLGLARGYLSRPDLTAERFVPDPFSGQPGARLYRTGDLARWGEDGRLDFLGRVDHQVKVRGFRIELGEVEAALRAQPGVAAAVCVVAGGASGRLVAYTASEPGATVTAEALKKALGERLPRYMVPSQVVVLEALPLLPNGKVDRAALPDPLSAEAPRVHVAPRDDVEARLTAIYQEVLGRPEVGVTDNFFELGGDSILSIQVVARARQQGLVVTARQVFNHPTVAELAQKAVQARALPVEEDLVTGEVPLAPPQRWFLDEPGPHPHHFNQVMFLTMPERIDRGLFEQAVARVVDHHDAFRLRFDPETPGSQRFAEHAGEGIAVWVDLTDVPEAERASAIAEQATRLQSSLDLRAGPLARMVVFDVGASEPLRLLLIVHHLIIDGVSWRILVEDLKTAVRMLARGQTPLLPPRASSYGSWVRELVAEAGQPTLQAEAAYWLAETEPDPAARLLVASEGADDVASTEALSVELDEETTRALLTEAPGALRAELRDVLLAALAHAFSRTLGMRTVPVEMEGHGRSELTSVDVSRTVGWFTTLYPVSLPVAESEGLLGTLKRVKEKLRGIPRGGLGYGLLRYLAPPTPEILALRQRPRPPIIFNYLGQFDQVVGSADGWGMASEPSGPPVSPQSRRRHEIEVSGAVVGGRLQFLWTWSSQRQRRATLEALGNEFLAVLRELVVHARAPAPEVFAPSDFPGLKVDPSKLDSLIAKLGRKLGR
nr:NRPS modules 10-13 [Corallococcus coralloides]